MSSQPYPRLPHPSEGEDDMTDYLPPVRPKFRPEPPRRKPYGHIVAFAIAAVALIVAGWSWDRLHSLSALLMSQEQRSDLHGIFAVSFLAFLTSFITALVLLSQRND